MNDAEKYFKKPAQKRYDIFIKEVAETEEVFGLLEGEADWALLGDDDDSSILPVFPNAATAELFRQETGFDECEVAIIDLTEFLEWLDDMDGEGLLVAIAPNPHMNSVVMKPERLKVDIQARLAKEEGDGSDE